MLRLHHSSSGLDRLDAARAFIRSFSPATELLLIGASRESVDDLVRGIARDGQATFGLHRMSFFQLVARLAASELADGGLAPATPLGAEAVAARVTFEALGQGRISRLAPVSRYPGFPRALAATLGELRLERIEPGAVGALADDGADIAELLRLFEREVERATIADRATMLRLAIHALAGRRDDAFADAPVLLLDVPIRSSLELDLVRALAGADRDLLATVPDGDRETWTALEALGPTSVTRAEPPGGDGSGLTRLKAYLFSDQAPAPGEMDDEVRFFSAPGEGRECIEIARHILDEARRGISFDEMAVFVRAPEVYSGLLETAFRRAEIPAFFARGTKRPDPTGRAFLALLACASERLSARRFAEYLSFAQLPDLEEGAPPSGREVWTGPDEESLGAAVTAAAGAPGEEEPAQLALPFGAPAASPTPAAGGASTGPGASDGNGPISETGDAPITADTDDVPAIAGSLRAPRKWEEFLVEAAVIGGKDRWRKRLTGLRNELRVRHQELAGDEPESPRLPAIERDLRNLDHLAAFALPVIDTLDGLPARATWGEWLRELVRLAPMVLRRPERVLTVLAELEPMSAIGPVTINEVRSVLTERLTTLEKEHPPHRYGQVFVATPEQARGRSFDVVFVPGLAERVFPQRPREDPLLLDGVRARLSRELRTQEDRGLRERLLLRLAAGAARSRIYLSYPRVDVAEARPRVPSFYGLDVARAIRGSIPDFEELERDAAAAVEARLAWPAPPDPMRAIDPVEHDLAVLGSLLRITDPDEAKGRARYLLELNEHLARSLRSRWLRWRRKWSPADGIVRKTDAVAGALAAKRPNQHVYSVTALQKFSTCPYQFLLSAIYRLEPRQDAVALVQLDPLTRGRMFHETQAETLRALKASRALPVTAASVDAATKVLDRTLDRLAVRYREDLAPAIERVWLDEVEAMRADLRAWLRFMAAEEGGWEPVHFEFMFGLPIDENSDTDSVREPATLPGGWKLHGAIDLIERKPGGALRVTDHKTGANRTSAGLVVGGGEMLQPVLYSLAVEAIKDVSVAEARLFFATSRGGFAERPVPINDLTRRYGLEVLEVIDRAIAGGALPPAPRPDACAWCDFRSVCGPNEEYRTSLKDRALVADLDELRTLP